jgi:hypothetical protein
MTNEHLGCMTHSLFISNFFYFCKLFLNNKVQTGLKKGIIYNLLARLLFSNQHIFLLFVYSKFSFISNDVIRSRNIRSEKTVSPKKVLLWENDLMYDCFYNSLYNFS